MERTLLAAALLLMLSGCPDGGGLGPAEETPEITGPRVSAGGGDTVMSNERRTVRLRVAPGSVNADGASRAVRSTTAGRRAQ